MANKQQKSGGYSRRGPSKLWQASSCPKRFTLRHALKVIPQETSTAAMLGTLVHLGVAYHYTSQIPETDQPDWYQQETLDDALERVGEGYPGEIHLARDCVDFYKMVTAGEPFRPVYVEHEFEARVVDLDPDGADEGPIDYTNPTTGQAYQAPALNDEVVTCRSDVVGERDGVLWIRDHKTKRADWWLPAYKDRLPPWKENNEFSLNWQALVNLHIVRFNLGVDRVAGFEINRIKRDPPFDRDCHVLKIPEGPYKGTPRVIRECVRKERAIMLAAAKGERPIQHFWECYNPWPCDYISICKTSREGDLIQLVKTQYKIEGQA